LHKLGVERWRLSAIDGTDPGCYRRLMRSSDSVAQEALALPVRERAALVLHLAESLDEDFDADTESAWANEVVERLGAVARGEANTCDAAQALADARAHVARCRG
jgi:hypothetical protein